MHENTDWKIGYKLLARDSYDKYYSPAVPEDLHHGLVCSTGVVLAPPLGRGPMCVFTDLHSVKSFVSCNDRIVLLHPKIFRCAYLPSQGNICGSYPTASKLILFGEDLCESTERDDKWMIGYSVMRLCSNGLIPATGNGAVYRLGEINSVQHNHQINTVELFDDKDAALDFMRRFTLPMRKYSQPDEIHEVYMCAYTSIGGVHCMNTVLAGNMSPLVSIREIQTDTVE